MSVGEEMNKRKKLFIELLVVILSVYLGFRFILPLVIPFVVAFILAWIVRPFTEFLYKKARIPRLVGGITSLLLLISLLVMSLFYLGNLLIKQFINFVQNIPAYINIITGRLDYICSSCDELFGLAAGSVRVVIDDNIIKMVDKIRADVIPGLTARTLYFMVKLVGLVGIALITIISAVLIIKETPEIRKKYEKSNLYNDINKVTEKLADAGIAYIRAQILIMVLVAVCCVTGLVLIKNEFALLMGLLIAILDALPVIGSGIILIPWTIIMLLNGNIYAAAILITVYLLCQIIRELVEPKLIGNRIGIKPLYTLMSMYIGLKLFGIAGFFLGPIALIIIIAIMKVLYDKELGNKDSSSKNSDNKFKEGSLFHKYLTKV
jgi:sporulation integral membrane protein YtvI